jgi:glutaredoxin 3
MLIKMYTKDYCSFCFAAKSLLSKRGFSFEEVNLSSEAGKVKEMREATGGSTVPQIVIDGKAIGGYSELVEMDMDGKLENCQ